MMKGVISIHWSWSGAWSSSPRYSSLTARLANIGFPPQRCCRCARWAVDKSSYFGGCLPHNFPDRAIWKGCSSIRGSFKRCPVQVGRLQIVVEAALGCRVFLTNSSCTCILCASSQIRKAVFCSRIRRWPP